MKAQAAKSPDEYLANVPEPAHSTLQKLRATIKAALPKDATEIITYGMPGFYHQGALLAYAAFKAHCSLFPMSAAVIASMPEIGAKYETAKGTIRFPSDKPLPATLVRKIVKTRLQENKARAEARAHRPKSKKN